MLPCFPTTSLASDQAFECPKNAGLCKAALTSQHDAEVVLTGGLGCHRVMITSRPPAGTLPTSRWDLGAIDSSNAGVSYVRNQGGLDPKGGGWYTLRRLTAAAYILEAQCPRPPPPPPPPHTQPPTTMCHHNVCPCPAAAPATHGAPCGGKLLQRFGGCCTPQLAKLLCTPYQLQTPSAPAKKHLQLLNLPRHDVKSHLVGLAALECLACQFILALADCQLSTLQPVV